MYSIAYSGELRLPVSFVNGEEETGGRTHMPGYVVHGARSEAALDTAAGQH